MKERPELHLTWQIGHTADPALSPQKWWPARVPGAVQRDYAHAHGWPPFWQEDTLEKYRWMEDVYWVYRARLEPLEPLHSIDLAKGQLLLWRAEGVDYACEVFFNEEPLVQSEGIYTPLEAVLTPWALTGGELRVVVHPAPKSHQEREDHTQANRSCKPPVSYGWDFHPRLIPLGLWRESTLRVRPPCDLRRAETSTVLSEHFSVAQISVNVRLTTADSTHRLCWEFFDPTGKRLWEETLPADHERLQLTARLENPRLWWPRGQGEQPLYESRVTLFTSSDSGERRPVAVKSQRVGLRTVRLVMAPGQWNQPGEDAFPKPQTPPPITLEINGRSIFAKGSNWVPPEVFPGTLTPERMRELLTLAAETHFNLLRVWGGGLSTIPEFYDICDELGLMVWQEFPLACNAYPDDPAYLDVLDRESRWLIVRLRRHVCLVLWCGGNELFNAWSGMTDQSLALRLLNRNCYELDPQRPFLPTAPVGGMGHENYLFRYRDGRDIFQALPACQATAYTEFGVASPAPLSVLESFLSEEELERPLPEGKWRLHHAFGAWHTPGIDDTWLCRSIIDHYFGPSPDTKTLVDRGLELQALGLQFLYEEARRQAPRCSMALSWCFNEPWPTAANNSLVAWPCVPKPALERVRQACRPVLASARLPRFSWLVGDVMEFELWLLNDSPAPVPSWIVQASLRLRTQELFLVEWKHPEIPAHTNLRGPSFPFPFGDCLQLEEPKTPQEPEFFYLHLHCPGQPERDSTYPLLLQPSGWSPVATPEVRSPLS